VPRYQKSDREDVIMSPEQLAEIDHVRPDADGFQREAIRAHVNQLEAFLRSSPLAFKTLPSVIVAKIKGRKRPLDIDGQHRVLGAIAAGSSLHVTIIPCDNIDQARFMFLPLNARARKLKWWEILDGSTCPAAEFVKTVAESYGVTWDHVVRTFKGLTCGTGNTMPALDKPETIVEPETVDLTNQVLRLWTSDERWKPESTYNDKHESLRKQLSATARNIIHDTKSIYSVPGVLHSVCAVLKSYSLKPGDPEVRDFVTLMRDRFDWSDAGALAGACRNGMDYWCELYLELSKVVQSEVTARRRSAR